MPAPSVTVEDARNLAELAALLNTIRQELVDMRRHATDVLDAIPASQRASAENLLHYLALRRHDVRHVQGELAALGLSSLGRAESHVLDNVDKVLEHLTRMLRDAANPDAAAESSIPRPGPISASPRAEARKLLAAHAEALLGPPPAGRDVRIMVTMPTEAAHDYDLVRHLVAAGMDCMRINCAHDGAEHWQGMIGHLRRASRELNRPCRVMMDLAGPKLRTGPIEPGPQVLKWRPHRDTLGRVVEPARIWLTDERSPDIPPTTADAVLPVPSDWLMSLEVGDRIELRDAREKRRVIQVVAREGRSCWGHARQTAYITTGTPLRLRRRSPAVAEPARNDVPLPAWPAVGTIPACEQAILLRKRDTLILTANNQPGKLPQYDDRGGLLAAAEIGCTLPEAFRDAQPGEAILFDDGRISGIIRSVAADRIEVEVVRARSKGEPLRADKGINLPDTRLKLPALTCKDLSDLEFVAQHADLVGYSFVRSESDVYQLQQELQRRGRPDLGIVLKIETREAFDHLPQLLLAAMRSNSAGVMIARGDLAVECGYERLAEVQEEILWLCEAAHMPVIWATQVLESFAKSGIPSRAEITDAAMGVRAECVMLNKGPYICEAVQALDNILRRMQAHQFKKSPMLRPLRMAQRFVPQRSSDTAVD